MFSETVIRQAHAAARRARIEPAALLAVMDVESRGRLFAIVDGRKEPLIRFEGHYFDRRLAAGKQAHARRLGLASPVAGMVANPSTQAGRWAMLGEAMKIDAKAACESTSWGIGQVMGAHWHRLGYPGVEALVAEARSGAAGQIRLMVRHIDKAGLTDALNAHDWPAFARGYNGPGFAKNGYDRKLAAAHARHAAIASAPESVTVSTHGDTMLRHGSRGESVAELQRHLVRLGYRLRVDGLFGRETETAIRDFQEKRGLPVDGIAGPKSLDALTQTGRGFLSRWWRRLKAAITRRLYDD